MIDLEKIDILRERTGVSYEQARNVLRECDGDVVEALIRLERESRPLASKVRAQGSAFAGGLRALIAKGNATRIRLVKGGNTVMEAPATAGIVGLLAMLTSSRLALLGGIGAVLALLNRYRLEIDRPGLGEDGGGEGLTEESC